MRASRNEGDCSNRFTNSTAASREVPATVRCTSTVLVVGCNCGEIETTCSFGGMICSSCMKTRVQENDLRAIKPFRNFEVVHHREYSAEARRTATASACCRSRAAISDCSTAIFAFTSRDSRQLETAVHTSPTVHTASSSTRPPHCSRMRRTSWYGLVARLMFSRTVHVPLS